MTDGDQIVAEGGYTEAELIDLYLRRVEPWRKRLLMIAAVVVGVAIAVWVVDGFMDDAIGPIVGCLVLVYMLIEVPWLGPRRRARAAAESMLRDRAENRMTFDESGITLWSARTTGELSESHVPWSMVKAVESEASSMVFTLNTQSHLLIFKRFFAKDKDWQRFIILARRCFNPEQHDNHAPIESTQTPTNQAGEEQTVEVEVTLTRNDLYDAVEWPNRSNRKAYWYLLACIVILGVVLILMPFLNGEPIPWTRLFWLSIFAVGLIGLVRYLPRLLVRLAVRKNTAWKSLTQVSFRASGLGMYEEDNGAQSIVAWPEFMGFHFSKRALLLILAGGTLVIVPWRCFASDSDRDTTRRLVHRHLGTCLSCGYTLRGTQADECPECGDTIEPPRTWTMPATR